MNHSHRDYFEEIELTASPRSAMLTGYLVGTLASLLLTLAAYALAMHHALSRPLLIAALCSLAIVQALFQIVCFFHFDRTPASRERQLMFAATGVIVVILVAGSVWIMWSLGGRMMPSTGDMENYMQQMDAF